MRRASLLLVGLVLAVSAGGVARAEPSSARTAVYFADPARAALLTRAGRRLAAELERARAEVEAEVRTRETAVAALRRALEKRGAPADRAAYDEAVAALGRFVDAEEARLERRQDEGLAPLLAQLDAARVAVPRSAGVVLDASVHAPLVAPGPCDATAWLAKVVEGEAALALPDPAPCRRTLALLLDPRPIARALPESKALTARLDAFVRDKQVTLDGRARELAKLPPGPDTERRRLELAERYQAYAAELAVRERDTQAQVDLAVRHLAAEVGASLLDAVLVEHEAGGAELPIASCEITPWLVDLLEKGSVVGGARPRGCPVDPVSEAK